MTRFDVAVVGAGPAGMAATVRLRKLGLSVLVADEQPTPGGQVWRGVERNAGGPLSEALGTDYGKGEEAVRAFRSAGAVYRPGAQVWQIEQDDGWQLFLTESGKASHFSARALLLAVGAQERPAAFPGWTLPGVMTVGAAQILLKSGRVLPEGPIWIAGAGPLPLLYATQVLGLNGRIAGFLDTSLPPGPGMVRHLPSALSDMASLRKGLGWWRALRRAGCRIVRRAEDIEAQGDGRLATVGWSAGGRRQSAPAGVLLVHEGVVPQVHATLALGCDHEWKHGQNCLVPRLDNWGQTSREGLFVAGDGGGIGGWGAAALSGDIAALGIARFLGVGGDLDAMRNAEQLDARRNKLLAIRPFLDALYPAPQVRIADDTLVCRCEEVTAGRIRAAARDAAPDPNAVKAATRAGMGPCQGRQCGYTVQALIAEVHGLPVSQVGFFNIRPPLKPITLGELALLGDLEVTT